jgi:hypothetical protein
MERATPHKLEKERNLRFHSSSFPKDHQKLSKKLQNPIKKLSKKLKETHKKYHTINSIMMKNVDKFSYI